MDWSIQEIARLTGTTSRTLRHYDQIGLLPPSSIGSNGYRRYDETAVTRLQRILLLRELGLSLPTIAEVVAGQADDADALTTHLELLRQERERLDRKIQAVHTTVRKLERKETIMAEESFDGFDHTHYRDEVEQRWGKDSYASSARWWESKSAAQKAQWRAGFQELNAAWASAATSGVRPDSEEAQALARRQRDALTGIPGTPRDATGAPSTEYILGLAEMYVTDERFAANYGGIAGAEFVRDAMRTYAAHTL